jgi:hypothetical protein
VTNLPRPPNLPTRPSCTCRLDQPPGAVHYRVRSSPTFPPNVSFEISIGRPPLHGLATSATATRHLAAGLPAPGLWPQRPGRLTDRFSAVPNRILEKSVCLRQTRCKFAKPAQGKGCMIRCIPPPSSMSIKRIAMTTSSLRASLLTRGLLLGGLIATSYISGGCAMCCSPYDDYYPFQGGAWIRTNPTTGRVGSAFAEAGQPALAEEMPASGLPHPAATPAPASPASPSASQPAPIRSVIPRKMGETYLRQAP